MDFSWTPEQVELRERARKVAEEAVARYGRHNDSWINGYSKEFAKELAAHGWIGMTWPVEFGGGGRPAIERLIVGEEMIAAGAPIAAMWFGDRQMGPTLITYGRPDQQAEFLPRILSGETTWCIGMSEPNAGSDLASLKTTAERVGDHFVINGQKTWTTLGQYADWIFVLARTDPAARKRQEGISFILVDMKTPGITLRPIITIDGGHEVNEVFFDEVRVPAENLVGELNKGWDYAKFLLSNERIGIARIGMTKERLARVKRLAQETPAGEGMVWDDPDFRRRLAWSEIELKALEITQMRVVAAQRTKAADKPDPSSSILKIKGSEIQQQATQLLMEVAGPYALPRPDRDEDALNLPSVGPEWADAAAPLFFNFRKVSIYGGSNEIQRNIIAKAFLGL